ncbi:MAG: large conductance mechanosensitive channel protein MscL [Leptolyngbyaceae cyanobacterium SM2_3_12]|nr:large conductance mechanosensitive channel protein MscL [Leptolyngbyaceae cyanobacterium SM2_3_12]
MASGRRAANSARGFFDDFKDFINRGNLVDLALAVVLGGAFGAVIASFVDDIIMPALINPLLAEAGGNWQELVIGPGIAVGKFLGTILNFLIIALVLFIIVQLYEKMQRRMAVEAEEAAEPTTEEKLNSTLERLTDFLESRVRK